MKLFWLVPKTRKLSLNLFHVAKTKNEYFIHWLIAECFEPNKPEARFWYKEIVALRFLVDQIKKL